MTETKRSIDEAMSDLKQLRDQLKLQAHLAKMEASDAWTTIEPALGGLETKLHDAASKLEDTSEKVRLQATLGLADVKTALPKLEQAIDDLVHQSNREVAEELKGAFANLKKKLTSAR
ncbi:hypothetical protein L6R52_17310 [Myxococcota bacterium]|nr:hypothetical protein [Myxococcota bacterium]